MTKCHKETERTKALQTIFKEFSILLKDIKLITGELIGVDGAFYQKSGSNFNQNFQVCR